MKTMGKLIPQCLLCAVMLQPAVVHAQWVFTTNNGAITITGYQYANATSLDIFSSTNGYPVTGIAAGAFASIPNKPFESFASLTNVTIPDSVNNIGDAAFANCNALLAIKVASNNPAYSSLGGVLFDVSQSRLIRYPAGLSGTYTIPNSVTNIWAESFSNCPSLTSVTIGTNVTSIGDLAFASCTKLLNFTIPDNVSSIGNGAFFACKALTNITIGTNVTSVGNDAFLICESLTSVTIPNSVTNIGQGAFAYCYDLMGIYFTGNVPPFNDTGVFANVTVYYLPGTTGWGTTFGGCPAVLWNPQPQANNGSFGIHSNGMAFKIIGNSNLVVVVQACTNLGNPFWTPLQTITLTNGSSCFSDPQWTNYPSRFYGLGFP